METGFVIYNFDEPQMRVWWNKTEIHSEWLISWRHPKIPRYMFPENITKEGLSRFCESRQPPRTRYDIDYLLEHKYHLQKYMPIEMCMKSRGITHSDDLWLLFDVEEKPRYEDITVR
ncbi:MAG: hypothetical protein ACI4KB_07030 [Oscillospiraceae bacterium]